MNGGRAAIPDNRSLTLTRQSNPNVPLNGEPRLCPLLTPYPFSPSVIITNPILLYLLRSSYFIPHSPFPIPHSSEAEVFPCVEPV